MSLTNLCMFCGSSHLWCSHDNQRCYQHLWAAEPMAGVANTFQQCRFHKFCTFQAHIFCLLCSMGRGVTRSLRRWGCHSLCSFLSCHLVVPPSSFLSTKPGFCPVPAPDSAWCPHSLPLPHSYALSPPHQVPLPYHKGSQAGHTVSLNLKCPQGTVLWPQSLVEYSFDFFFPPKGRSGAGLEGEVVTRSQ